MGAAQPGQPDVIWLELLNLHLWQW